MAQVSVIRDFVVALGFKTDKAAADKMKESLENVEIRAKLLNKAIVGMAAGVAFAVKQTATELDKLYFASKRIGASADNINAYGNAIEQMGGNAEQAISTLESLSEKMRNSPGYEGMLNNLGVATKEANGAVRDRVEVMKDLSGVLAKMPQYQANAYANSLGIDQNTLLAMRDGKFISNMEKYQKIQKQMGMNDELTKSGNEFMTQYRDLSIMAKTGFLVVLMQAGKILIPLLKGLNTTVQFCVKLFSHLHPMVKDTLGILLQIAVATLMLSAFVRMLKMLRIGLGVIRIFFSFKKSLGSVVKWLKIAKEWALKFGQAIKFLFRIFAMTPIGRIVTLVMALVTALGLLWDDYQTWKEGGKSLIDWGTWSKEIDYVINKIKELMEWIENLSKKAIDGIFGDGSHQKLIDKVEEHVIEPVAGWFGGATPMLDDKRRQEEEAKNKPKMIDVTPYSNNASSPQQTNKPSLTMQDVKQVVGQAQTLVIGLAKTVKSNVKEVASKVNGNDGYTNLGSLIASGEGDYNSVNRGLVNGKNLGAFKTDLSKMTINEILQRNKLKAGDSGRMNAVGKYQIIASTMKQAMAQMNLTGNEKFTPEMQEKIFREFLIPKRKGLNNYLKGNGSNLEQAQYEASMEWASIPVPTGFKTQTGKISDGTSTYYDKNKGNKAKNGHGVKIRNALQQIKNGGTSSNNFLTASNIDIKNPTAPSRANPEKSQYLGATNNASNVTIHQNYQTDMVVNGAKNPQDSANAVKRQQENANIILARNAQAVMP
ncbi:phage tail tape measure protein [Acinetobacter sp. HY1485]|uniref:phage tail tape measure protein n=1 Tax=Acinetobacter sp. HY1485 TaxID=2970918 RepID=UPI003FA462AB